MTEPLRVLVACEFSGIVRDSFSAKGCDAWSAVERVCVWTPIADRKGWYHRACHPSAVRPGGGIEKHINCIGCGGRIEVKA